MNEMLLIFLQMIVLHIHCSKAMSSVVGSKVQLQCDLLSSSSLQWFKGVTALSFGPYINADLTPEEFRLRLSITVDNGKYNLIISNLKKTDEGLYSCLVGVTESPRQTLTVIDVVSSKAVSSVVGSTVTLQCPLQPTGGFEIEWDKNGQVLSSGNTILDGLRPIEYRDRLSIIVDKEKYHLKISNLVKSDEGQYRCSFVGTTDSYQTLTVIVSPTSVGFENKVDKKLQGTEGQNIIIRCSAVGGDPKPNVIIQIGTSGPSYTGTGGVVAHTIPAIDRSYDGSSVSCRTEYPDAVYQSLTDTANIFLNLKPISPTFSLDPIITEDTKQLILTCRSTGSRPASSDRIWLLGDSNTDITSSSSAVSQSSDPSKPDTYVSTSTLTYTFHKQYNGKSITCGFRNNITGTAFVQSSRKINVKYAPDITVQNKTFQQRDMIRELQCTLNGNPSTYTFNKWQHLSKYGQLIRSLNSAQTQSLPVVSEAMRYQDTGEYICTASNGIVNSQGQVYQQGSGYVFSRASPFFLEGVSQTVLGQTHNDVTIEVSVYSEPKFTGLTWYKDVSPISHGNKYLMSNSEDIITTTFHGVNVQVDGYKLTLTIRNIQENDFKNYTVRVSNGIGEQSEHTVTLKSVGPPDPPTHFNVTDIHASSILVKWKPGFDGGADQYFIIQYRGIGTNLWNSIKVESTKIYTQDYNFWFTLNDLTMATCYALRMYAENIYSSSAYTDVIEISTGHKETQNTQQSDVAGVAGGLSAVILIMFGVILVLLWRLNACNMCKQAEYQHKRNATDTTQHYTDVLGDNSKQPSVHSSTERNNASPVGEYEELGMRDQPNVYSQADNAKQQTERNIASPMSEYEELGMRDQPNVYSQVDNARQERDDESHFYLNKT